MNELLENMRRDYQRAALDESEVYEAPLRQFRLWLNEAIECNLPEPTAMTLATATREGYPSARIVLLKGVDDTGFRFFTNYKSRKGEELAENTRVALVFCWLELERQVRIEGTVSKLTERESLHYFQQRPKDSQIAAWVSPQSRVVPNRAWLEAEYAKLQSQYADSEVLPKPEHWGGYLVQPYKVEFWQGRPSRLHDRILYTLTDLEPIKRWKIERLAP